MQRTRIAAFVTTLCAEHPRRRRLLGVAVFFLCLSLIDEAQASGPTSTDNKSWALLIGVEQYDKAPRLPFIGNDVRLLSQARIQFCDYDAPCIKELVDVSAVPHPATRETLLREIPEFLRQCGPHDTVLVYFSGHGFRDAEDRLHLAPRDCDPKNAVDTSISVSWLREQIEACRAEVKLLILDACHAGTEKHFGVLPRDTARDFIDVAGVITLASSREEERSIVWEDRQQSLFSYFLVCALHGHADDNNDGLITVDELYGYIEAKVPMVAERSFGRTQRPVRIIGPRVNGVPIVARLAPQELKVVLGEMAVLLAEAASEQKSAIIGVPEFVCVSSLRRIVRRQVRLTRQVLRERAGIAAYHERSRQIRGD